MTKSAQKKGQPKGYHPTLQWIKNERGGITIMELDLISFIYGKPLEQITLDFSRCKKTAP